MICIKRPKSHEIDTRAQRIFSSKIPVGWVTRTQNPDYGIDYEIEVFHGEQPSGIWFRIQLKGTEEAKIIDDNVHFSFETDKIQYYLSKVPFPVFLFLVDVRSGDIYWLFLQKYGNEKLKKENSKWFQQQNVTLKIPKTNLYTNQVDIETEAKNGMSYAHILLFGAPHWSVPLNIQGAIDDIGKIEKERNKRLREQNEIDIHLASKYYDRGDRKDSLDIYNEVFERTKDKEEQILEHLSSVTGMMLFMSVLDKKENFEIFKLSRYGYVLSKKINNKTLMYYFKGCYFEATYYKLREDIINQQILMRVADGQRKDNTSTPVLKLFQSRDYNTLLQIIKNYSDVIAESSREKEYWVSLDLLIRLIPIILYNYRWSLTQYTKKELKPLIDNATELVNNALAFAKAMGYVNLQCEVLKYKALLLHYQNDKEYIKILQELKEIALKNDLIQCANNSDALLNQCKEESPFPEGPDDFPQSPPLEELPDAEIDDMYRKLAEVAGIDLRNPNDEIAQVVNVGLKDRNPERILKNCKHLEIAIGCYGVPGEMLGLPTAGFKFLFCKYGSGSYAFSLDSMYESFRQEHCVNCKNHEPMPEGWKWSYAWQQEKDKNRSPEFQKLIDGFFKRNK